MLALARRSRNVDADLVAHIGEVDARRLYARQAAPSMHKYCVDVLRLTDFEAYLRIAPRGVLAEEARAGRARARARLGRTRGLISAATEYLRAHPNGRAASEMIRRRADARRQSGACASTRTDT